MASAGADPIDLAREEDFRLGALTLRPSQGKALTGAIEARVEPRVMEVLILLNRSLNETVTRDELIDACWSGRAVSDDAVTRAIGKARQLGRLGGGEHFTIDTVPKVGFRLVAGAAAAASELNSAQPGAAPLPPGQALKRLRAAPVLWALAGLAALLLAALTVARPAKPSGFVEIAPFAATGDGSGAVYVAERIGERIAHNLPGIGIFTAGDTAARRAFPLGRAPELRVSGAVERIDERVVVTARISAVASGVALWSGVFERPAADYRGLEEGAAISIAAALHCALSEQEAAGRRFEEQVLSLWLRACDAAIFSRADVLEPTRALMAEQPDRAGSHAMFALNAAVTARWSDVSSNERAALWQAAEEAANRALAIDAEEPRAHAALAALAGSFTDRGAHLQRALAAAPDRAPTLVNYLVFLREVGRLDEARKLGVRLLRMSDPRLIGNLTHIAFLSAMAGDDETAEAAIKRYETIYPDRGSSLRWTNTVWWADPAEALEQAKERWPNENGAECFEAVLGDLAQQKEKILPPETCAAFGPEWRARLFSRTGNVDEAYAILHELEKTLLITQILFYPEMAAVRRDARFLPLVERLGLLQYWRETNQWPDLCREPGLPYDCRTSNS